MSVGADATTRTGLLFPGQGSQRIGMGKSLADRHAVARRTFEEADEVLGFGLSRMAWEGPEEILRATEHAQPALYAHSAAAYRVAKDRLGAVAVAAGHSLGEFSAHAAAGSFSFADGLRAVRKRGELMARASESTPGTMAAVLGLDEGAVRALCREVREAGAMVVPGNLNASGQVVVSGELDGVARLTEAARKLGAKRVTRLSVSAAFHSPLMAPAADEFREHLHLMRFERPAFPIVSNVTAEAADEPERIRELLVRQLTAPVRWVECVSRMVAMGAMRFAELGPGKVLAGLNRRNAKGLPVFSLGDADSLDAMDGWE